MPRILRIINRFNLGGPAYNVAYLTKYLSPEFETLLIGGEKEKDEESSLFIFQQMGLTPMVIPEMSRSVNFFQDVKAYRRIKKIIRDFKPDIVHTHAAKAGALGRLAAFHCGVPVVVHTFHGHVFHSYFGKIKTTVFKQVERYLAAKSSAIIAISEKQKQELCIEYKICSAEKTVVIPLGFDLTRFMENQEEKRKAFRKQYEIDEDEICIVIIGRLAPVKNHPLFLKAIQYLKRSTTKKIRAFIVGDGDLRHELTVFCKELNLDYCYWPEERKKATITFTSWIQDVSFPLAASEIVCLTSFNEGTPVSLIEAQAAGKPIVTTKVGGIENSVYPEAAFLIDSDKEKPFFEALLKLTEGDELRKETGLSGRAFAAKHFTYTRLIEDVRTLYHSLLKA